jgi:putative phage-type endonuclease
MKILQLEQNTDEWLSARKGKITGSKLKKLVTKRGVGRKLGFYEIMAERIGLEEAPENPMDRGHRLEPEALDLFAKEYDKEVEAVGFCVSESNPSIAVSPDGLIKVDGKYKEAVEVKCLSTSRHLQAYFEAGVPKDYEEQVMQYFIVNEDLEKLYLVFYDPRLTAKPLFAKEFTREELQEKVDWYLEYQTLSLQQIDEMIEELTF